MCVFGEWTVSVYINIGRGGKMVDECHIIYSSIECVD